jgi:hypothetical protein
MFMIDCEVGQLLVIISWHLSFAKRPISLPSSESFHLKPYYIEVGYAPRWCMRKSHLCYSLFNVAYSLKPFFNDEAALLTLSG